MLVPAAEDMPNKVPVSQRVNSPRVPNDDPTLCDRAWVNGLDSSPHQYYPNHDHHEPLPNQRKGLSSPSSLFLPPADLTAIQRFSA